MSGGIGTSYGNPTQQSPLTSNRDYANQMARYHQAVLRDGPYSAVGLTAQSRAMHRQALGAFQTQVRQFAAAEQKRAQGQQPATQPTQQQNQQPIAQPAQQTQQPAQQTQQSAMSNYLSGYANQPNYFSGAATQQRPMQTTPGDWFWTGSGWGNQPQQAQPSSLAGWLRQQGYQF